MTGHPPSRTPDAESSSPLADDERQRLAAEIKADLAALVSRMESRIGQLVAERDRLEALDAIRMDAIRDLQAEHDRLRAAVEVHRAAIKHAGPVHVADYDSAGRAEAKHAADQRLWEALDA